MKRILTFLTLLVLASLACNLAAPTAPATTPPLATAAPAEPPTRDAHPPALVKGFGLSPQGFPLDYGRFPDFLTEVASMTNGGVMWNGAWRDDVGNGADAGRIPQAAAAIMQSAAAYTFTPSVVFGWRTGSTLHLQVPTNPANDWTNADARRLFQDMLVNFATTYRPPFVFLGNENDAYYAQDPADYVNWIGFYNDAYDAIKGASPGTLVGPVFNFEHLAGAGALNGWSTPYWEALEAHDLTKVDVVGVTVYPWLNYATPEAAPNDYLAPLLSRIGSKPLAITETGWPAENLGGLNPPWETSEAAQVTYLARLSAMLAEKDVRIVN
ncbi:MAG: hypothetical protein HY260_14085, partial [Chloroflexi bacterium]|nr:hypothetical protein [Chloroflexota bacterium]